MLLAGPTPNSKPETRKCWGLGGLCWPISGLDMAVKGDNIHCFASQKVPITGPLVVKYGRFRLDHPTTGPGCRPMPKGLPLPGSRNCDDPIGGGPPRPASN